MLNMVLMALLDYEEVKQYVKKEIILKAITMLLLTKLLTMKTNLFRLGVYTRIANPNLKVSI